jgi:DNA-binding transcriptional regulator/RsmH inhibitor MraZ
MLSQAPMPLSQLYDHTPVVAWHTLPVNRLHVAIPNQYFKDGDQITITVHPDGCLLLYPIVAWEPIERILKTLPLLDVDLSSVFQNLFNQVSTETIHKQQIGIPESFLTYAEIESEVIWAETATHVQLWQPALFATRIKNQPYAS